METCAGPRVLSSSMTRSNLAMASSYFYPAVSPAGQLTPVPPMPQ